MNKAMTTLIIFVILVTGLPVLAMEGPLANGDSIMQGGDILVSRAEERQVRTAMAYNDDDDEWLVVWQDEREGGKRIYGQLVDGEGILQGDVIDVSDSDDDDERANPSVAYDGTQGRYFVVWQNDDTTFIEGRVLNADGSYLSDLVRMPGDQFAPLTPRTNPKVAYNPRENQHLVIWEYETAADDHDIQGCTVEVDGTGVSDGFLVSSSTLTGDDLEPALAVDNGDGRYLVVWQFNRLNNNNYNIVGRRLNQDGTTTGNVIFLISNNAVEGDELLPGVAFNGDTGQMLVVWLDQRDDDGDIYGRLVNNDSGNTREDEFVVYAGEDWQGRALPVYNPAGQEYLVAWNGGGFHARRVAADGSDLKKVFTITEVDEAPRARAVGLGDDEYLAVWAVRADELHDIQGQRLNQKGDALGYEIGLTAAARRQILPDLAFGSGNDEWLVVWGDLRNLSESGYDIYGQFVTREGLLRGEPIPICTDVGDQRSPKVAYNLTRDEFLVVWEDYRGGRADIYGQRVDAEGFLVDAAAFRISPNPDNQENPVVAYHEGANQYLVVWEDDRDPDDNIYGRRLNGDGTAHDDQDFQVCARQESQHDPAVAYSPVDGLYLVAWTDFSLENAGIAGQWVGTGEPALEGPDFDIRGDEGGAAPAVACNTGAGECLVIWSDGRDFDDSGVDLYGRRVSGDGTLLGAADIAISVAPDDQFSSDVSYNPETGSYFAVWDDGRNPSTSRDVYGQALSASGRLLMTDAATNELVWQMPDWQDWAAVASDAESEAILVVWQDGRSIATTDIYGRLGSLPTDLPAEDEYVVFLPLVVQEP